MKIFSVFLLVFIVCLSSVPAVDWFIGPSLGYTHSFVSATTFREGTYNTGGPGFDFSFSSEAVILPWLSLDFGAEYIMKSNHYVKEGMSRYTDNIWIMNNFIDFPFTARFILPIDRFSLFLGIGGYLGARLFREDAGFSEGVMSNMIYFKIVDFELSDNLFDAGLIADIGGSYRTSLGKITIRIRYRYSLTSLKNNSQRNTEHTYQDSISIDIGFAFSLGRKE